MQWGEILSEGTGAHFQAQTFSNFLGFYVYVNYFFQLVFQLFQCIRSDWNLSMAQLSSHIVANFTGPSFRLKDKKLPNKTILGLAYIHLHESCKK